MVGTQGSNPASAPEAVRTLPFRGRRSRNKVSVGEPADGSFEETFFCPSVVGSPSSPPSGRRAITLRHLIANGPSPFPGTFEDEKKKKFLEPSPGETPYSIVAPSAKKKKKLTREGIARGDYPSEKRELNLVDYFRRRIPRFPRR